VEREALAAPEEFDMKRHGVVLGVAMLCVAILSGARLSAQSSGSEASQAIAKETGGNADDFVKATEPRGTTSSASCTVLFRVVQAGTMAPITSGYGTGLDLNQSFSGSKTTVKEDMQGNVSFSGGTIRDVTSQFQNGILRIPDALPHFHLDVEFGGANAGTGYTALIYRQCFRPETVLLLVINKEGSGPADWLWVKSGKYSTIAASQATAAASTSANLVTNGDFESGNTGFTTGYTYGNVFGPGAYWVGKNAVQAPGAYPDWYNGGDHTTGTGNMLVVNGANSATTRVWEEVVPVTPNTAYTFSYWGAGVDHESQSLPQLQLQINGSSVGSNDIPKNSPDNGGKWENFTLTWNSGSSTSADLALFDLNTETTWNDFALDDISFGPAQRLGSARATSPVDRAPVGVQAVGGAMSSHWSGLANVPPFIILWAAFLLLAFLGVAVYFLPQGVLQARRRWLKSGLSILEFTDAEKQLAAEQVRKAAEEWSLPPELNLPTPRSLRSAPLGIRLLRSLPRLLFLMVLAIYIYAIGFRWAHNPGSGNSTAFAFHGFLDFLQSPQWQPWMLWPSAIFGGLAGLSALPGHFKRRKEQKLLRCGQPARAVVTEVVHVEGRGAGIRRCHVEYQDAAGNLVKTYVDGGLPQGQVLTVLYDPDKPSRFTTYPGVAYEIAC
jgi:hypothetical protein